MNKRLRQLILLLALLPLCLVVRAANIYVSPMGNDANAGTQASPKATLNAALRQARELRRLKDESVKGGIHIILAGGNYNLSEPVFIRPEDSGTAESPTWIEAATGTQPVLSGGVNITGFTKATSKVLGLPAAAQGKVWVAAIPQYNGQQLQFRQLWVNGKKAIRARNVNNDNLMQRILQVDKARQEIWIPAPVVKPGTTDGLEMVIHQMWAIANLRVKTLNIEGNRTRLTFHEPESRIQFEHPWPAAVIDKDSKQNGNSAYYLSNAIEFLNEPGEWYADVKTNKIYYWPRSGENLANAQVMAPALQTLLKITGTAERPVSYVYTNGLSFAYATWLRPSQQGHVPHQAGMYMTDAYKLKVPGTAEKQGLENQAWVGRPAAAVEVSYANHTGFQNCRFEHMASTGLDYQRATHHDKIEGNLFKDIGGTAIQVGVFSDESTEVHLPYNPNDKREVCTDEQISNNLINDVTNEDWGCVGIGAGYVKNITIEHNDISEVSYSGISMGWGWTKQPNVMADNKITGNKIYRYGKNLYDVAGIYTLSTQPGSLIAQNYVDSIYRVPYAHDLHHWFYLYCDEGSSGFTVKDNWTPADKFLQNANGPGNKWENNSPQVASFVKQNAGLEPAYKKLLSQQYLNPNAQFNYVGVDAKADKPQVLEIVGALGSNPDVNKAEDICTRQGIPVSSIYKWKNHIVLFGYIPGAQRIKKQLQDAYTNAEVKLYDAPFYTFSSKQHCGTATRQVTEWDNIILTANLVPDAAKQQQYMNYHAIQFTQWPEVARGFCNAGFQQLLVYRDGRQLMLIISIPKGESLDKLNPKTTENNPRVNEWNKIMAQYQEGISGTNPGEVWVFLDPLKK